MLHPRCCELVGGPRPSQGSLSPEAPGRDLSQQLIAAQRGLSGTRGCQILHNPRVRGLARVLANLHLVCMPVLGLPAWRMSCPGLPPGGARDKAVAGHSASEQSLSAGLAALAPGRGGRIVTLRPFSPHTPSLSFFRGRTKAPRGQVTQQELASALTCSWTVVGRLPSSPKRGLAPFRAAEIGG